MITHQVGSKPVVGTGVLVLAPRDVEASILVDDLVISLVFAHSEGEPELEPLFPSQKMMRITVTGRLDAYPSGVAWELPNIGTFNQQNLHLALLVTAVGITQVVRTVHYTFTTTAEPL